MYLYTYLHFRHVIRFKNVNKHHSAGGKLYLGKALRAIRDFCHVYHQERKCDPVNDPIASQFKMKNSSNSIKICNIQT